MIVARRLEVTIEVEPLVRERCWFSCDIGTHPETLAELWPDLDFDHLDALWWGDQGESEASLDQRCTAFRAQSDGLPDRHQVVVITHWGFIRSLTGHRVQNADLVRFDPTAPHPGGGTVVPVPDPC